MTEKVTYVSAGSSEEFHQEFERAAAAVRAGFGRLTSCSIGGVPSATGRTRKLASPIDSDVVVGEIEQASYEEAARAVDLAADAFPAWAKRPWRERVAILRRAAQRILERRWELAALMAWEVGKNRIEAVAEVEESADLLTYYCDRLEAEDGYRRPLARLTPSESTESVFLPYGAWAVISPFNFPMALAAGMTAGALVTGNTVVLKPSLEAPLSGALLCEALWAGGVPRDALHLVMGSGEEVGATLLEDPRTAGIAFTGSYEVGMKIVRGAARDHPRPVVVEMGGKNPTIVTAAADLDAAAEGVAKSAFGFGGQKCSACSRAYVVESVAEEFTAKLVERARAITVGNPLERDVYLGPLIHAKAVATFERWVELIEKGGGTIVAGGHVLTDGDLGRGHYVEPTVALMPDAAHPVWSEELFVPILAVRAVADLDEGLTLANRSRYGLTAGIFSRDQAEVRHFLDRIEAGVTYVNRKSGATTGAWPGVNPFGGWKASGACGPAALGPHYLLKFLREQSRTVNEVEV